ncbi:WxL domain-containing protein [Enterococcus faecalis]|uniref:WxL domain-containing protein n=1 Tax=Enterococcus faecalis TaxID=1351 RepID=UPI003EC08A26
MKRNKWQRLAAIGLCSSLLVNAFSGVTAVAETVTIESSPTAESSVKEETQASSETQETMTETSREEVTQKTEKQAEVAAEKKEDTTVKAEPKEVEAQQEAQPTPQPPVQIQNRAIGVKAGNLVSLDSQFRELSRNERNRSQLVTPEARLGLNITSKDNTPLNTSDFKLKTEMGLTRWIRTTTTSGLFVISDETMVAPNVPTETGIDIILPSQTAVIGFVYRSDLSLYYLKDPELTVPKYIDTVELKEPVDGYTYRRYFGATGIGNPPNVGDYPMNVSLVKTNGMYVINQPKAAVWPVSLAPPLAYQAEIRSSPAASTENYNVSASGFYAMQQDYALVVTHKKVTENFVDATGAKITPPTGFTQGQQTSITSNDFTYTSAKALPDTYKAGGKTYKFKGWYKGKTKPATLKTTKTPSYDVTYDDNDDLNVVYEEAVEFPEETYQFGFVNQDGRLVKPDDITITYDYSEFLTNNGTNTWNGIALNQKAITEEKLKKITMPKSSLPKNTVNGEAMINISFSLPKYYTGLSIYDKSGKIDSNYPLPPRHYYMDNQEVIGMPSDATFINWLTLAKAADNSYVFKDALTSPLPINSSFPMMRRGVTGYTYYHSLDAPVYYHLTQRKVTENFVDATGAKITPPTGFTQGQQTSITSNDFTYTSAKALPDTYKADGKTYKFKGWYKGKTKPATLKTTKTPSYGVTYDDNDDMTAVYEEVMTKTYNLPAKDVYFGYVDEAGNLLNPADFTVEAELGESTATESAVLGKVQGTNQVTSKLKKLSIPGKSYDFPVAEIKTYGTRYVNHTIPKRYKTMSISPTATYTGDKTKYPVPDGLRQNIDNPTITVTTPGTSSYKLSTNGIVFGTDRKYWTWDTNKTWYAMGIYSGVVGWNYNLLTPTGTIYYYLENRRITENFVDSNGTKITPPTGFTQGKQTVIDSDNFTYTSAKALPASYTVGDKNYKFKGWYKGTDQTALKTTKTPSYTVTYDGKDDMTAVYEEVQDTTVYPGFYAEFFDEQGKAFTNPLTLSGNYTEYLRKIDNSPFEATGSLYPMVGSKDATVANRYKVETKQSVSIPNNFFEDYPADILHKGFALNNFDITNELKYVDQVEATTKTITLYDYDTISDIGTNLLSDSVTASLNSFETVFNREVNNTFSVKAKWGQPGIARETIPNLLALGSISSKPRLLGFDGTSDYKQTINYKVTRKQVTENFVDAAGVKISAPTGFTQGKQTPMTSNSFKYTAAKALPASYSAGGKTYTFQGWYKGKTKPNQTH